MNNVDQAGPLWLALEGLLESLPTWIWLAAGGCVALAALVAFALLVRRRP